MRIPPQWWQKKRNPQTYLIIAGNRLPTMMSPLTIPIPTETTALLLLPQTSLVLIATPTQTPTPTFPAVLMLLVSVLAVHRIILHLATVYQHHLMIKRAKLLLLVRKNMDVSSNESLQYCML